MCFNKETKPLQNKTKTNQQQKTASPILLNYNSLTRWLLWAFELILPYIHLQIQFPEQIFHKWFHHVIFPTQLTSVSPDCWWPYFLNIEYMNRGCFSNLNSHLGAFDLCSLLFLLPVTNLEPMIPVIKLDFASSNQILPERPFSNHSTCRKSSWEQGRSVWQ